MTTTEQQAAVEWLKKEVEGLRQAVGYFEDLGMECPDTEAGLAAAQTALAIVEESMWRLIGDEHKKGVWVGTQKFEGTRGYCRPFQFAWDKRQNEFICQATGEHCQPEFVLPLPTPPEKEKS